MPALNKVVLIGHLCADPELKQTPSGVYVTSFSIGVQRRFKDANGQYPSDFINIVAWRQTAEFICRFFTKGKPIVICGSIQTRNYTDQQGNKRYVTEVIADEAGFASSMSDSGGQAPATKAQAPAQTVQPVEPAPQSPVQPQFEEITGDNDLPF